MKAFSLTLKKGDSPSKGTKCSLLVLFKHLIFIPISSITDRLFSPTVHCDFFSAKRGILYHAYFVRQVHSQLLLISQSLVQLENSQQFAIGWVVTKANQCLSEAD